MHDSFRSIFASRRDKPAIPAARLAFAALMLGNVCLAFGPLMVRLADVGPIAAGFWRLAIAAPLLLLLGRVTGNPVPRLGLSTLLMIALGGLFFAADLAAWHSGILHTKLANATLFGNVTSFVFPFYGFLLARAWPGRNQLLALLLAAAGVGLLLGRSYDLSPRNFAGDLLCILAGLFYTGYLIAIDRGRAALKPLPVLTIATLAGIAPLLILSLLFGEVLIPHDWTPLLILAISSQVVGQGLMVFAIGHLSPVIIGLGLLIQPVIASATGFFVYGEMLGTLDFIGAVAIGIALVLVRRPDRAG